MKTIYALTDYQGRFESKRNSKIYRSGMECSLIKHYFEKLGFDIVFKNFCQVYMRSIQPGQIFIYTSTEDPNYRYKAYIEDIIYSLELRGAIVLPSYKFLRANNNKVFMELIRDGLDNPEALLIHSHSFGTYEDLVNNLDLIGKPPYVIKGFGSAASIAVRGANSKKELLSEAKKLSRSVDFIQEIRDFGRKVLHKGYTRESLYRQKFIVQNKISGLSNDWKVIAYGNKYYILARYNRENDFRASGSGKFAANDDVPTPKIILEYARKIHHLLGTPNVSVDIAYNKGKHYLIDIQGLFFGSATHAMSDYYWIYENSNWKKVHSKLELEQIYAESICSYILSNDL